MGRWGLHIFRVLASGNCPHLFLIMSMQIFNLHTYNKYHGNVHLCILIQTMQIIFLKIQNKHKNKYIYIYRCIFYLILHKFLYYITNSGTPKFKFFSQNLSPKTHNSLPNIINLFIHIYSASSRYVCSPFFLEINGFILTP